ncbi:hypothetical protein EDD18DRAFT_1351131 [Armillaria luteobubalina]|uniref:Uncharacterized protein n=1 Tax=Armillaria luteobubalina TaxID=153913 RepID=A0AA39UQ12_9AGAR|nr:hypothetical protein EDD18DRAFT_1351131 [Armillaria luteobubalina]
MGDGYDAPSQRLQASILLARAAIGSFFFFSDVDVQILLPLPNIQQAVNLLAPTYAVMSHKEIVDEAHARRSTFPDYTRALHDDPDNFARLKLVQPNSKTNPSHILISNAIYAPSA